MKLYLDENIHSNVTRKLKEYGFDVVSVHEIKANGFTDEKQLEIAISEKRAIVTYDLRDFINLAKDYIAKGRPHYGIILISTKTIPQEDFHALTAALKKLLQDAKREKGFLKDTVMFLKK